MNNAFCDAISTAFSSVFSSPAFHVCVLLGISFYIWAFAIRLVKLMIMPPRCRVEKKECLQQIVKDVTSQKTANECLDEISLAVSVAGLAGTASGRGVNQGFTCDMPKPCKVHRSCSDCLIYHEGVSCYGITE